MKKLFSVFFALAVLLPISIQKAGIGNGCLGTRIIYIIQSWPLQIIVTPPQRAAENHTVPRGTITAQKRPLT